MTKNHLSELFSGAQQSTGFKVGQRVKIIKRHGRKDAFVVAGFALVMGGPLTLKLMVHLVEGLTLENASDYGCHLEEPENITKEDRPDELFTEFGHFKNDMERAVAAMPSIMPNEI